MVVYQILCRYTEEPIATFESLTDAETFVRDYNVKSEHFTDGILFVQTLNVIPSGAYNRLDFESVCKDFKSLVEFEEEGFYEDDGPVPWNYNNCEF